MLSGPIFLIFLNGTIEPSSNNFQYSKMYLFLFFFFFLIGISSMSWLTRAFYLYIVFKLPNNRMYYVVRRIIQVYISKCKTQS